MPEKRSPYTFTLMFNSADPHHQKAVEIINQQGRRKSQFIAAAILHYVDCNRIPTNSLLQDQQLEVLIEQIVIKTLATQDSQRPTATLTQLTAPLKTSHQPAEADEFYEGEIQLSDEDSDLLLRGLDSFLK